ncbi:MAG: Integral membrane protein, partial [uncultured Frankineae bacterium]
MRAVDPTVARLTAGSLLGRRRALLLLALPAVLLVLAGVARTLAGQDAQLSAFLLGSFALGTVVPLLGLLAGTGAIGPEIDDGSIVYLLSKPLSRHVMVVSKLLV